MYSYVLYLCIITTKAIYTYYTSIVVIKVVLCCGGVNITFVDAAAAAEMYNT